MLIVLKTKVLRAPGFTVNVLLALRVLPCVAVMVTPVPDLVT